MFNSNFKRTYTYYVITQFCSRILSTSSVDGLGQVEAIFHEFKFRSHEIKYILDFEKKIPNEFYFEGTKFIFCERILFYGNIFFFDGMNFISTEIILLRRNEFYFVGTHS